ncbi:MAG: PilZ domain-containing protein [Novosphingobium sp.]|nr:PilZ domain-containing protein [Novosphingobium sp.]
MASERRKYPRSELAVEIDCRLRGVTHRGKLTNVSQEGCCIEVKGEAVLPGDRVVLAPSKLLVLPATVAWTDGVKMGLTFASPMIGTMLDQFFTHQLHPEPGLTGPV